MFATLVCFLRALLLLLLLLLLLRHPPLFPWGATPKPKRLVRPPAMRLLLEGRMQLRMALTRRMTENAIVMFALEAAAYLLLSNAMQCNNNN
jgi:hypothetical protein